MIVIGDWVAGSMVDCAVVTALEYGGVAPCFSMWFFVKVGVVHGSVVGEGEVEAGVGMSVERSQFMPSPGELEGWVTSRADDRVAPALTRLGDPTLGIISTLNYDFPPSLPHPISKQPLSPLRC